MLSSCSFDLSRCKNSLFEKSNNGSSASGTLKRFDYSGRYIIIHGYQDRVQRTSLELRGHGQVAEYPIPARLHMSSSDGIVQSDRDP